MLTRPVDGTWFEFFHHNKVEGEYWNPACRGFTELQWRQKLREIRALGMEYIVLLCTSLAYSDYAESYFPGGPFPFPEEMVCKNPREVLFDECDRLGLKIFVSCGFYGDWYHPEINMTDGDIRAKAFGAMERLHADFGDRASFYGWYLPDETGIEGKYPEIFIDYVNEYRARMRALDPNKPALIAPYGVAKAVVDDAFVKQLERLDCDFVAYQDGVGIVNGGQEHTARYFEALRKAHDRAGRSAMWADVEVFRFQGQAYHSPLLPGDMDRIEAQLNAVSPYVDKILIYQYQGMMCPPDSPAPCGHPDAVRLYRAFADSLGRK